MTTQDLTHAPVDFATAPVILEMNDARLKLIKSTVAKNATDAEVGMFLELANRYALDPFAKEIWCAKSEGRDGGEGHLLIMVGRDGLRKIAQRNALKIDGDVVRARDSFRVTRGADRRRAIEHAYEEARREDAGAQTQEASARGPIVGAWAEVYDEEGEQRGFFYAPLKEYRPTNDKKLRYSPWGSQESVMILAAAERQALRQATPLSGLLAEGEDARLEESAYDDAASSQSVQAINDFVNALETPETVKVRLLSAVHESNRLAPNSWTLGKMQMTFLNRSAVDLEMEAEKIEEENEAHRERAARRDAEPEPVDAEVVPEEPAAPPEDPQAEARAAARRGEVMNRIAELEVQLEETGEDLEREALVGELEALQEELDALPDA